MRLALACVVTAMGCTPLADIDYAGEPLITLEGSFTENGASPSVTAKLALLWQDTASARGPGAQNTAIPYSATSLGRFIAGVPVPAPDPARFGFADGGPQLAEAFIHVASRVPITSDDLDLGIDPVHVLVFADADVTGGSAADYLGGPVAAGYHLREFVVTATPGAAQRELIERCAMVDARAQCEARRGYQLQPIDDREPLRIVVRAQ